MTVLMVMRWAGISIAGLAGVLLLFVAAAPLGLLHAYPRPPNAAVEGPLGLARSVTDVRSLYRNAGESLPAYLARLTHAVADGMIHYWTAGDSWVSADSRFTGISASDNYLLWLYRLLPQYRANLDDYEFLTPAKALARGYGFCSQVSKLVYSILHDQGIDAEIRSNPEHTVVEAAGNVLDPDYGVFIPHPVDWIAAHPDAVAQYYAAFGASVPLVRHAYLLPWHVLGSAAAFDDVRAFEAKFERLKWLPPLAGIVAGLFLFGAASLIGRRRAVPRPDFHHAPVH